MIILNIPVAYGIFLVLMFRRWVIVFRDYDSICDPSDQCWL